MKSPVPAHLESLLDLACRCYPGADRDGLLEDMSAVAVQEYRRIRARRGRRAAARFLVSTVGGIAVRGIGQRLRRRLRGGGRGAAAGFGLDALAQDLRFAARGLRKEPGLAAVALVTLALGIGATTAVFSAVNGILVRSLPYPEPEELVWVAERHRSGRPMSAAWSNFRDWSELSTAFEALATRDLFSATVLGGERPLRVQAALVSRDFWRVFRVRQVRGRLTLPEEHRPGAGAVAVLREDLWRREFGAAAPSEIRLEVLGQVASVVGVVPAEFDQPEGAMLWVPVEPTSPSDSRTAHNHDVVGRLAARVSAAQAHEELDALTARILADEAGDLDFLATGVVTTPLHEHVTGDVRTPLLLLLGAAFAVLLVGCTNLASTLLARGEGRRRELAVRSALGAGRGRIVTQLLTEGVLLASTGGAAGLLLAAGLLHLLRVLEPGWVPRLEEVGIDETALLFTVGLTLLTALLFSLLPALRLSRAGVGDELREGGRGSAGSGGGVWKLLVGTEVALACFLLVGAGLLLRSFDEVMSRDPGFDGADVMTAQVSLSRIRYPTAADHARFYAGLVNELAARPGVAAAGVASSLPLSGSLPNGRLELDGDTSKHFVGGYIACDAGYFEALDIPLLRGRTFDDRDGPDDPHVAVVSRRFAEEAWPGEDPIGKQVSGGGMDSFWQDGRFATVVGVVEDVLHRDLTRDTYPTVYFPIGQRSSRIVYAASVVVEMEGEEAAPGAPILRSVLRERDPDVPERFAALDDSVAASVADRRFVLGILGGFAVTALLLAAVGIYGVVSYSVARRRREMGIRLALGAAPAAVRKTVLTQALVLISGGLGIGVLASLALGRVFESLLYGVTPRDPATLLTVPLVLLATAALASWIPARRSTRIDPLESLRAE